MELIRMHLSRWVEDQSQRLAGACLRFICFPINALQHQAEVGVLMRVLWNLQMRRIAMVRQHQTADFTEVDSLSIVGSGWKDGVHLHSPRLTNHALLMSASTVAPSVESSVRCRSAYYTSSGSG